MKMMILSRCLLNFLLLIVIILIATLTGCASQYSAQSEGLTGDRILFVTYAKAGTASLFIVNADGTGLSKLTDLTNIWEDWPCVSYSWNPVISPDKKKIAYFSSNGYLSILNMDDAKVTDLMEVNVGSGGQYLAWSPDGSKIAYVNSDGNLHVVNIDGTGDRELATANGASYSPGGAQGLGAWMKDQIRRPVWSSDGKLILFDDFRTPDSMSVGLSLHPMQSVKNRAIYSVNTDISDIERTKLVELAVVGGSMSYGNKILISIYKYSKDETEFYIMNDDGTDRKPLVPLSTSLASIPMWSPDGNVIAYFSRSHVLKMIDASTLEDIPLNVELKVGGFYEAYDNHNTGFYVDEGNFIWSPDSHHIAYVHRKSLDEFAEIRIVRNDLSCEFLTLRLSETDQDIELIGWVN